MVEKCFDSHMCLYVGSFSLLEIPRIMNPHLQKMKTVVGMRSTSSPGLENRDFFFLIVQLFILILDKKKKNPENFFSLE